MTMALHHISMPICWVVLIMVMIVGTSVAVDHYPDSVYYGYNMVDSCRTYKQLYQSTLTIAVSTGVLVYATSGSLYTEGFCQYAFSGTPGGTFFVNAERMGLNNTGSCVKFFMPLHCPVQVITCYPVASQDSALLGSGNVTDSPTAQMRLMRKTVCTSALVVRKGASRQSLNVRIRVDATTSLPDVVATATANVRIDQKIRTVTVVMANSHTIQIITMMTLVSTLTVR